ncbi:MAG TPA: ABC transporter permease [Gemmatimonadales bacterium]|jgi:putative ABC transport system permease protein
MDTLLQDVRYSLRRLAKSPLFALIVIVTLSLGIGANTAIFSAVNAILLRPLPYPDPEQLVTINHFYPTLNNLKAPISAPGFRDYQAETHSFSSMAVQSGWNANLTGVGEPVRLQGNRVTGRFFSTLGIPALIGRTIQPGEDSVGQDHVVVLSHGVWQRLFGSDRKIVGSRLSLNGESYEVIGVMPAGFRTFFGRNSEIWAPLSFTPEQLAGGRTNEYLNVTARLKPRVGLDQATAELHALGERMKQQYPGEYAPTWTLTTESLNQLATGDIRPALLVLLGAVGFVLLIACANVANLLLARAAGRTREIAVRTALGATRDRLLRQLLTESVILSLAGGVLGLALAWGGLRMLVALKGGNLPRADEIGIDGHVMTFTLLVALVTGLLFGLAPALHFSGIALHENLKEGNRGATSDRSSQTVRRALVVAELALALTLLTGAGLLIKSFARLENVDPGFNPDHVLTFDIALPRTRYPSDTAQIAFFDAVLPLLSQVPGIKAVGATSVLPFGGSWSTASFEIEGYQPAQGQPGPWGDLRMVSPSFFQTMKIPLQQGRLLEDGDRAGSRLVTVVDDEMVRRYWPRDNPIGKRITFGPPAGAADTSSREWIEVVGVVGHTKHEGLAAEPRVQYYLPYRQSGTPALQFAARTAGNPESYVNAVGQAVRSIDSDQPISGVQTMDGLLDQSVGQRKLSMLLLTLFSGIALLLASVGIYGVMSYSVAQRAREIGVRIALGAERGDVLRMVLRQGMRLALGGVLLGLVAAFLLTRVIASQLYEVTPTDPFTFVLVAVLLTSVALVANLVPAVRATRVDPAVVLREE